MAAFEVWAPNARRVDLVLGPVRPGAGDGTARHPLETGPAPGWWRTEVPGVAAGTDYAFSLDGGVPLPDPRSPWQPAGVEGPSRTVDHTAFRWTDGGWAGRTPTGELVYELHVGTFTPEGTFDAAAERLDHLVDLGVGFVEVMPVAAYPGRHGWGYDGVALYAVHEPYGGPEGFKRFVDACHGRGLGVILDVVYNHLGPHGNVLPRYGPYFTDFYATPWGPAINYDQADSDEVRAFAIGNAVGWFRDYHVDGLRLDAVHAIVDTRAQHLLEELSATVEALAGELGRPLALIAESDQNDPRTVTPRSAGGLGMTAQWSDDFHHALHAALTGERAGYYADFGPLAAVGKALTGGFVVAGRYSAYRRRTHGRPLDPARICGHRLVGYAQTHDQIGNRAAGERLVHLVGHRLARAAATLVLTSPFTPMLFMGEEWGASTPWQFFTDHTDPELAKAVSTGRHREFAAFGWDPADVPDPQDPQTHARSVLDWSEKETGEHAVTLAWHRQLVGLRRARPELAAGDLREVLVRLDEDARWIAVLRGPYEVVANLGPGPCRLPLEARDAEVLAVSDGTARIEPGPTAGGGGTGWLMLDGESSAVLHLRR